MSRDNLKKLLKGNVSLISKGRSNGQSYTDNERLLAKQVAAAVFTATGFTEAKKETTDEVVTVLNAVAEEQGEENLSVPSLCRGVYRAIEKERLADPKTAKAFPRKDKEGNREGRDHTSLGLLFRKGLKALQVGEDVIDQAFPSPYKGKGKKAG